MPPQAEDERPAVGADAGRAEALAALRESEERFRALFENMLEGFAYCRMLYDEQGRPDDFVYLNVNPAFAKLTGIEDAGGKRVTELIPTIKELNPEVFAIYGRVVETGEPAEFDIDFAPIGKWLHVSATRPRAGEFVAFFYDVTERKLAERHARESEERLRLSLAAADAGTWEWELSSGENTWSDELWDLYDLERALHEPCYDAWLESVHPDDRDETAAALAAAVAEGREVSLEWRVNTRDGSARWLLSRGRPEREDGGEIAWYRGVVVDVTDRKQAETALQESEGALRRLNLELENRVAQRTAQLEAANQELEAFSYSVSHDLRAPLRHVFGFAQLLEEHLGDAGDDETRHFVDTITRSAAEMGTLIDDLLQFSRVGRAEMHVEPVAMDELVREALVLLGDEAAGRHLDVRLGEVLPAAGDKTLLRQVWVNLLGNAFKYTRPRDPAVIEVGSRADGGETVYWVRDNGVGFDMQYADRLFRVFERLHRADEFEGTGIGLANVSRIVGRHGGRCWTEARLDEGATFSFSLPDGTRRA